MSPLFPIREPLNWQIYDSIPLICLVANEVEQSRLSHKLFTEPFGHIKSVARTNMFRSGMLDHPEQSFVLQQVVFSVMGAGRALRSVLGQLESKLIFTFILGQKPYVEGPAGVVYSATPNLHITGDQEWHAQVHLEAPISLPKPVTVSPDLYVILKGELMRPIQ